jgi:Fe-S-cluster-containing dehydrogenase component
MDSVQKTLSLGSKVERQKTLGCSPSMTSCRHRTLELLPNRKKTKRCLQCHLTIDAEELGAGYCPECFQVSGKKQYEFQDLESAEQSVARYRCEECGLIIEGKGE